jgi:hypothetical protein
VSGPLDSWNKVEAFARTLPGTESGTSYRMPNVKIAANGRGFVWTGHEAETSFAVAIDLDTVEMLKETEPETYWQSPHYQGYPAVLVRYDSPDPDRVRHVIELGHAYTSAKKPVKPRKKK